MSLGVLSPEARILLLSAGGPEADDALRSLLAREIRWPRLLWLAQVERAEPILYHRLNALAGTALPADAMAQLRKLAMVVEFRMLNVEQRLQAALGALSRAGIDAVLLKGAGLATTVYRSFMERPMVDLDLLVDTGQALSARDALLSAGWTADAGQWREEHYQEHHHLPPLRDTHGGESTVEIHTALFMEGHPFRLNADEVRRGARTVVVGGWPARVPNPLHQLLHACLHYAWSHEMAVGSWRAFRDVEAIIRADGFDWRAFVALATENQAVTCCFWTLELARELALVPVPAEVLTALRPRLPDGVLRRLRHHYAMRLLPGERQCISVGLDRLLWEAGVMPRRSGHGAVRPWDEADRVLATAGQGEMLSRWGRASKQLGNLGGWTRYARTVLAPRVAD